jgi:hypothetical protein
MKSFRDRHATERAHRDRFKTPKATGGHLTHHQRSNRDMTGAIGDRRAVERKPSTFPVLDHAQSPVTIELTYPTDQRDVPGRR